MARAHHRLSRRWGTRLCLVAILLVSNAGTPAQEPLFVERSAELGVDFRHRHFGTGEKWMIENMGSGVAVFDANGDDRLDLYFVQGAPLGKSGAEPRPQRPR